MKSSLLVFVAVTFTASNAFGLLMDAPLAPSSPEDICKNSGGLWAGHNSHGKQCVCLADGLIHASDPLCGKVSSEKKGDRCVARTDCMDTFCDKDKKPAPVFARVSRPQQAVVNSQQKAAKEKNNPAKGKRSRVALKKNPEQKVMTANGKNTIHADEPQKKITPQCHNGRDDDADGWVDLLDPGCENLNDKTEKNDPDSRYECNDGKDNDSDGFIDGFDRDCEYPQDKSETSDPPCPDRVVCAACPACPEPATKTVTVKEAFTALFRAWHPYVMGTGVGFGGEQNAPFALGPGFGLLFEVDNDWEAYFDGSYVYAFDGDDGGHSALFRGGVNWYFSDNLGATVGADSYHVGINSIAFTGPGNTDILMRAGHVGLEARFFGKKLRPWAAYMIGGASPGQFVAQGAQAGLRFHWW